MSLVSETSGSHSPSSSRNQHSTAHRHRPRIQWRTGLLLLLLACLVCRVAAESPAQPVETLSIDNRIPVKVDGEWTMVSQEELKVGRRDLDERETSTAPAETTTVRIAVSSVTSRSSSSSTTSVVPSSPLPSPLDGSISSNFTKIASGTANPCPAFLNSFLESPTFKQCYPFSLLLQGSTSFFEAEKSLVSITQVLDASCSANVTFCATYLSALAKNLTSASNCGADFELGNSVVVQSYVAMVSYQTLYGATCLKDPASSAYCFARAVTNLTTPANVYFYYLPLNISLPGSSVPACSWCLEKTMGIYQSAAADRALPIANTYQAAAQQVNTICGPNFANTTLPNAVTPGKSAAGASLRRPWQPGEFGVPLGVVLPLVAGLLSCL
ncbi:hypothetical protein GE09DRAFT_1221287 [Coniochaeta sp. 2T2.1]|nr:hypothetical protein GE09DRAFT_1221287 [Coniochaeta sp. 2T2.1]